MRFIGSGGESGSGSSPGGAGPYWVINSDATSVTLPNGQTAVPLTDPLRAEYVFDFAGTVDIKAVYAMSIADANAIQLTVSSVTVQTGDDPDPVIPAPSTVGDTPGSDLNQHEVAVLASVSVAVGDRLITVLDRGTDSHPGDVRVLAIYPEVQ